MEKRAEIKKQHKVAQSNKLITAKIDTNMSVIAQKLIRLAISNIDSVKDTEIFEFKIHIMDFAKLLELEHNKHIYRDCKRACLSIAKTIIAIEDNRKKNGSFDYIPMFAKCGYDDGDGCLHIKFSEEMKPLLLHLKKDFTQIPLEAVLMMEHKYSIKVYELIKMKLRNLTPHADNHYPIEITVKELRRVTGTEERYPYIKDLKNRVLFPALKDIEKDQTAQFHCEVTDIKDGRTIVGFRLDCWSSVGWQVKGKSLPGQSVMEPDKDNVLRIYG